MRWSLIPLAAVGVSGRRAVATGVAKGNGEPVKLVRVFFGHMVLPKL